MRSAKDLSPPARASRPLYLQLAHADMVVSWMIKMLQNDKAARLDCESSRGKLSCIMAWDEVTELLRLMIADPR